MLALALFLPGPTLMIAILLAEAAYLALGHTESRRRRAMRPRSGVPAVLSEPAARTGPVKRTHRAAARGPQSALYGNRLRLRQLRQFRKDHRTLVRWRRLIADASPCDSTPHRRNPLATALIDLETGVPTIVLDACDPGYDTDLLPPRP
jgi:hypothetical protein